MILKNKTDFDDCHNKSQLPKLTCWINHNQGRENNLKVPTIKPLYEQKLYCSCNRNTSGSVSPFPATIQPPVNNRHARNCHTEPQSSRGPDHRARYFQNTQSESSCPCLQTQHTHGAVGRRIGVDTNPVFPSSACSQLIGVLWTPLAPSPADSPAAFTLASLFWAVQPQHWSSALVLGWCIRLLNPGHGTGTRVMLDNLQTLLCFNSLRSNASQLAVIQPPCNVPQIWP